MVPMNVSPNLLYVSTPTGKFMLAVILKGSLLKSVYICNQVSQVDVAFAA